MQLQAFRRESAPIVLRAAIWLLRVFRPGRHGALEYTAAGIASSRQVLAHSATLRSGLPYRAQEPVVVAHQLERIVRELRPRVGHDSVI